MKIQNHDWLFWILLLEDEDSLREDLAALLEKRLPGTKVVAIGTIEEALEILVHPNGFAIAILDIRVPLRRGMQPEANPAVAERLRELRVPCLFITGFRDTPDVQGYLRDRTLVDPPVAVIDKTATPGSLTGQLVQSVREWFVHDASHRVEACVNLLFGPSVVSGGPRSGTAALVEAQQVIVAYWPYLTETTRGIVRRWFVVQEVGDAVVTLSLFSADDDA